MIAANAAKKLIRVIQTLFGGKASRREERFIDVYYNCFDHQTDDPETPDLPEKEALAKEMKAVIMQQTGACSGPPSSHDTPLTGNDKTTLTLMVL